MKTELSPQAVKYFKRLDEVTRKRIVKAFQKLEQEPPQGDIKKCKVKMVIG